MSLESLSSNFIFESFLSFFDGHKILMALFALYLLTILWFIIKGTRQERCAFVYPVIVLILTFYNPFVMPKVAEALSIDTRFYRFFWILPVGIAVMYCFIKILSKMKPALRNITLLVAFAAFAALVFMGKSIGLSSIATNEYKINDQVIELSDFIRQDRTEEESKVLYSYPIIYEMHAYDPTMNSGFDRDNIRWPRHDDSITEITSYEDACIVLQGAYFSYYDYGNDILQEALEICEIDYVIVDHNDIPLFALFENACEKAVGSTADYTVFKCY